MIDTRKYEDVLLYLGGQYFIKDIQLVPDIKSWASDKNSDLREPYYPNETDRPVRGHAYDGHAAGNKQ